MPSIRNLCVYAGFALAALGYAGSAEAAKICKVPMAGGYVRSHPLQSTAQAAAVVVWSAQVAQFYSAKYANWQNAANRDFSCSRYTTVIGINAWRCRAVAKPCTLK